MIIAHDSIARVTLFMDYSHWTQCQSFAIIPLTISWMPPLHLEPAISAIACVVNRDVPTPRHGRVIDSTDQCRNRPVKTEPVHVCHLPRIACKVHRAQELWNSNNPGRALNHCSHKPASDYGLNLKSSMEIIFSPSVAVATGHAQVIVCQRPISQSRNTNGLQSGAPG